MPLTAAEDQLIAQAATLARSRIAPLAATWERERRIGREVLTEAVALGLTRLQLPASHGGLDASFGCKARVAEVLAAADFGFCMSWINTHNVAALLARKAQPAVAARYLDDLVAGQRLGCTALSEPGAGSDFAAISTTATRQPGGGWRIDGAKAWITNAAEADVVVLYAQTEPGSGGRGIAGFVVDGRRAGFVRAPGLCAWVASTASAPAASRSTATWPATTNCCTRQARPSRPRWARSTVPAPTSRRCAAAWSARRCGWRRPTAQQRHSFGVPLQQHQGWRWRLAEAATELAACRALVAQAADAIDAGADAQLLAAQAKLLATPHGRPATAGAGPGHGRRRPARAAPVLPAT